MIQLDTNLLIAATDSGHPHAPQVARLVSEKQPLACSSFAWLEFSSKPAPTTAVQLLLALLTGKIIPFTQAHAEFAGKLFQITGNQRKLRFDCCIAAVAILSGQQLATANLNDFNPFIPHGLTLFKF